MNTAYLAAAATAGVTGLAHSIIGEWLVFRRLRRGTVVPAFGGELLHPSHVRILWASWHALTLLGWGMAALLVLLAAEPPSPLTQNLARGIAVAMAGASLAVLVGTRGRHPGWLALALVAVLAEAGR